MIRAGAVVGVVIGLSDKSFAAFAIPTFVSAFVDVGGEFLPDGLATANVIWAGGANKIGVFYAEAVNEVFEFGGVLVDELLWRDVLFGGSFENFIAVFVGAGLEANLEALRNQKAAIDVADEEIQGMSNVWGTINIRDGGSNVCFGHLVILS